MKGGNEMEQIQYKTTEKYTKEVIKEIIEIDKSVGLTAENLLNRAKDKKSLLHDFFDWDNSSAAEKWRLHEARHVVNEIKIIVDQKSLYNYENVKVTILSPETGELIQERQYKSHVDIMNSEDFRKQMITTALNHITYWEDKYKHYKELQPIFNSIHKVKTKWEKK